eukprot:m.108345 g.108345  ORF g.108345 m.108345 type:complete len:130 (+) comp37307_c0_seq2:240-629(+)
MGQFTLDARNIITFKFILGFLTEGQTTRAYGPSSRTKGMLISYTYKATFEVTVCSVRLAYLFETEHNHGQSKNERFAGTSERNSNHVTSRQATSEIHFIQNLKTKALTQLLGVPMPTPFGLQEKECLIW